MKKFKVKKYKVYDIDFVFDNGLTHFESDLSSVGTMPIHDFTLCLSEKKGEIKHIFFYFNQN